ncbi:MAG TPA: hypothetical protein VH703_01070 [Solirubrobacterales bacterium]|jgi:hypothetical protein
MESSTARSSGWVTFAGIMFVVAGFANLIWGIGALANKEYLPEDGLLFSTLTFWGWIAIIWGALLLLGSYLVLMESPSGRSTGIVLAVVSAVFWLFALPVLPIFALTAILVDSLIIYGLSSPS